MTDEQKCIAEFADFIMIVSEKAKKKDYSLFSPTSAIGAGMYLGLPPICRMADELLDKHDGSIHEAMRAKERE